MQVEHLPPKDDINIDYPLKIKNLIERINESKSIENTKTILSRFYTLNSKDEQIKKIFRLLSYDSKTKTFSNELNSKNILDLIKNEYLPNKNQEISENNDEKILIVPKSNFILPNQNTFEIKNDFNNLLTNSVKNEMNLNSFNSKIMPTNILENNFLEKKTTFSLSDKKDDLNTEKTLKQKRKRRTTELNEKNNFQKKLKKSPTDDIYTVQPQQVRNNSYGLKEISNRVREIIKRNGQTSYKEISDEIVSEINQQGSKDEKNIRRRIYDSLNVMKSMKLFKKDKNSKKIVWNFNEDSNILDDDNNNDNFNNLYNEYLNELKILNDKIKEFYNKNNIKKQKYNALNLELLSLQSILERNKKPNMENIEESKKIYFPFIIIEFPEKLNSSNEGKIKIAMNESRTKAHFGFDSANRLYGDLDAITKIIQNNNSINENNNY